MRIKKFLYIAFFIFLSYRIVYAHEQWFLSSKDSLNVFIPSVFRQLIWFNLLIVLIAFCSLLGWVILNYLFPEKNITSSTQDKLSILSIRLFVGGYLIACSFGIFSPIKFHGFQSVLLAPDLLVDDRRLYLLIIEFLIGFLLVIGFLIRLSAVLLFGLLIIGLYIYGEKMLQYLGFYLGSSVFLLFYKEKSRFFIVLKRLTLQSLVGINFIYSSVSVKFFHPYLTMYLLTKYNAFTFELSVANFSFIMFVVETLLGIAIMLGYRLRIIISIVFILFLFMSYNVSENIFYHSFIYGPLAALMLLNGIPLFAKYKYII
jgi:hypothetical protein